MTYSAPPTEGVTTPPTGRIDNLNSRVFALPSEVADALIVKMPAFAKYDLGPCSFPHLVRVIDLLAHDDFANVAECLHDWLDRPESDTRECLICGTEVAG